MSKWLYFPGLRPDAVWTGALSPLVERLVVYGVVETESAVVAIPAPWVVRVVAPLGSDRARFIALFREMTGRDGAVIRGQLLAMASRPERDRDEATVGRLTGALHRQGENRAEENLEQFRAERIWQARLFLKLAEAVTIAETEISQGLAAMAGKQAEMLKALQGDGDVAELDADLTVAPLTHALPGRYFRVRDLLAAWAVFYELDGDPESLLLTEDPEAADLLADEVEKLVPGQSIVLPEFELAGDVDLVEMTGAFSDLGRGKVTEGLATLLAAAAPRPSRVTGAAARLFLSLRLLPGAEFRQVMSTMSGLPGRRGDASMATPYVLVGVARTESHYL